jgi:hypothetical protein
MSHDLVTYEWHVLTDRCPYRSCSIFRISLIFKFWFLLAWSVLFVDSSSSCDPNMHWKPDNIEKFDFLIIQSMAFNRTLKCWCYEFYFLITMLYLIIILVLIGKPCFLFLIQASSPLQVKYADGELERLGMTYFYSHLNWNILISQQFLRFIYVLEFGCYIKGMPS